MSKYTKYYFTLEEFRDENTTWANILGDSTSASVIATESNKLLTDYIIPRFDDSIVKISTSETPDYSKLKKRIIGWLNSTYDYYKELLDLYDDYKSDLMNQLSTTSTDTRAVTTTGGNTNTLSAGAQHSENRENDTPQNGGDWSDDEHTSNLVQNDYNAYTNTYTLVYNNQARTNSGSLTTTTDPETIINRLNDIKEKYVNLYKEWSDKFRVFIYNPASFEERNDFGIIYYDLEE